MVALFQFLAHDFAPETLASILTIATIAILYLWLPFTEYEPFF
ncbi:hypothetical protein NIES2104_15890 [Leptolyngbya sp. NIES-2104]|nr:hypothetical protein NIES2104_15890 [Leptolyngbya sp. NIES-2104]